MLVCITFFRFVIWSTLQYLSSPVEYEYASAADLTPHSTNPIPPRYTLCVCVCVQGASGSRGSRVQDFDVIRSVPCSARWTANNINLLGDKYTKYVGDGCMMQSVSYEYVLRSIKYNV